MAKQGSPKHLPKEPFNNIHKAFASFMLGNFSSGVGNILNCSPTLHPSTIHIKIKDHEVGRTKEGTGKKKKS